MELINLTGHRVAILDHNCDENIILPAAKRPARIRESCEYGGAVHMKNRKSIPVTNVKFAHVENLPSPQPGKGYIVSKLVATEMPHRDDLYITRRHIKNGDGFTVCCQELGQIKNCFILK